MADTETIESLTDSLIEDVKKHLGPIYKNDDNEVLKTIAETVRDEAFSIANRLQGTVVDFKDLKSCIFKATIIAYENRGIDGQTKQTELGQTNEFLDWHNYLQKTIVTHGKRYVI